MPRRVPALGSLVCLVLSQAVAQAQAMPTASPLGVLQLGAGYTYAHASYDPGSIEGVTAFADFDFSPRWGVEADFHYIALLTPTDIAENSVVAGPRCVFRRERFAPYARAFAGAGDIVVENFKDNVGKSSGRFFVLGLGGGLDIAVTPHIVFRVIDLEYQRWPNVGSGISPVVVTTGFAYRFH
jgi:opacity protein-like surface antigen